MALDSNTNNPNLTCWNSDSWHKEETTKKCVTAQFYQLLVNVG